MYPEGECCTATMEPGTLYVLITGTPQGMRPELSVEHCSITITIGKTVSFVTHFSVWNIPRKSIL